MTNTHVFTVNRLADGTAPDGSPVLGPVYVIADPARLTWEQVLDVLRLIVDGSPRRGLALFYVPAEEPVAAPPSSEGEA